MVLTEEIIKILVYVNVKEIVKNIVKVNVHKKKVVQDVPVFYHLFVVKKVLLMIIDVI